MARPAPRAGAAVNSGEADEVSATGPIEHMVCVAMPSMERRKKLEQCFTWLRVNFCPLTEYQEARIRAAMEVGKYEAVPE